MSPIKYRGEWQKPAITAIKMNYSNTSQNPATKVSATKANNTYIIRPATFCRLFAHLIYRVLRPISNNLLSAHSYVRKCLTNLVCIGLIHVLWQAKLPQDQFVLQQILTNPSNKTEKSARCYAQGLLFCGQNHTIVISFSQFFNMCIFSYPHMHFANSLAYSCFVVHFRQQKPSFISVCFFCNKCGCWNTVLANSYPASICVVKTLKNDMHCLTLQKIKVLGPSQVSGQKFF